MAPSKIQETKLINIMLGLKKQLQADFDYMSSQIKHNGTKGSAREDILLEFLRKHMPKRFGFSKGEICSSKGETSKQIDIIIYDQENHPIFYDVGNQVIVPSESVLCIIEIKSILTELKTSVENIKSVKNMDKSAVRIDEDITKVSMEQGVPHRIIPTKGCVFAYNSQLTLEKIAEVLNEENQKLNDNEKINFICVLDRGIIFYYNKINGKIDPAPSKDSGISFAETKYTLSWFFNALFMFLNRAWTHPTNISSYLGEVPMEVYSI